MQQPVSPVCRWFLPLSLHSMPSRPALSCPLSLRLNTARMHVCALALWRDNATPRTLATRLLSTPLQLSRYVIVRWTDMAARLSLTGRRKLLNTRRTCRSRSMWRDSVHSSLWSLLKSCMHAFLWDSCHLSLCMFVLASDFHSVCISHSTDFLLCFLHVM